ncbi:autorepressor SdpR family transcription factor [Maricaulis sp.]|uniref:autorepressor SdpR family transcription factor n=1 Tax=Maricaulis sp. TaxID=1486257 RepID=UPI003A8F9168
MNNAFKALSDPTRRRVLELLKQGPLSAGELADQFVVSKSTMSAHFAILREAGLVASEKRGKSVVYHLQLSVLEDALLGFARLFGWEMGVRAEAADVPDDKKEIEAGPGRVREPGSGSVPG